MLLESSENKKIGRKSSKNLGVSSGNTIVLSSSSEKKKKGRKSSKNLGVVREILALMLPPIQLIMREVIVFKMCERARMPKKQESGQQVISETGGLTKIT